MPGKDGAWPGAAEQLSWGTAAMPAAFYTGKSRAVLERPWAAGRLGPAGLQAAISGLAPG